MKAISWHEMENLLKPRPEVLMLFAQLFSEAMELLHAGEHACFLQREESQRNTANGKPPAVDT